MSKIELFEKQDIRIFISTHKDVELFDSLILQPVQVGTVNRDVRFSGMLADSTGENISELNPMFCELTTQYWAWKNVVADYYGFCHYRRYFNFSKNRYKENAYGEIIDGRIDARSQARYALDDESIRLAVEGFDVVTTEIKDLRAFPGGCSTPRDQYDAAQHLHIEDLRKVFEIVVSKHPEYRIDVDRFLDGNRSCFCNMFVMKREVFQEYCEWLFPILFEFVESTDMSRYSKEALRTPGHLSERLLNVFLMHNERIGRNWKRKQVQCVHFKAPEKMHDLQALGESVTQGKTVIPVVLAADNNYVPMLTTTIYSMLKNANPDYFYDIVVFEKDITSDNQHKMKVFFGGFKNASVRFCNVARHIESFDLTTNNPHISIETYYRLLIQELMPFYDKVLYLDSDLIIKGDVSELFSVEMGDNLLAAVRDVDYLANLNMKQSGRFEYSKETLELSDPYDYFQAGVLVLNALEMRKLHPVDEWLRFASNPAFIYNDQDAMNALCEGRVVFVGLEWNVMHDCDGRVERIYPFAPAQVFDEYLASRQNAKIIHYAGFEKPWKYASCDLAAYYWEYARETPYYECLVALLEKKQAAVEDDPRALSESSIVRRIADPILPEGSGRREIFRKVLLRLRGRA